MRSHPRNLGAPAQFQIILRMFILEVERVAMQAAEVGTRNNVAVGAVAKKKLLTRYRGMV